jgi:hypothetical protein
MELFWALEYECIQGGSRNEMLDHEFPGMAPSWEQDKDSLDSWTDERHKEPLFLRIARRSQQNSQQCHLIFVLRLFPQSLVYRSTDGAKKENIAPPE